MKSCCVIGCDITSENDVKFFEFPTSRALRRKWLDAIKLTGKLPIDSVVCSEHFIKSDYEEIRGKTRLKKKVVPTLFQMDEPNKPPSLKSQEDADPHTETDAESSHTQKTSENTNHNCAKNDIDEDSEKPNSVKNDIIDNPNEKETPNGTQESSNNNAEILDNHNTETDSSNASKNDTEMPKVESTSEKKSSDISDKVCFPETVDGDEKSTNSDAVLNESEKTIPLRSRKTRVKHVPERYPRFCDISEDSDVESNESQDVCTFQDPTEPDPKQDIEDIITNYHIKNCMPNKLASTPPPDMLGASGTAAVDVMDLEGIEFQPKKEAAPVFIEVPVDQDPNALDAGAGSQDCLMLLESVQVDVDPATLLLPERDEDDEDSDTDVQETPVKHDPISLVTSSDEDDVILQEPHIDTVEVSDETDEDDVPLVRLLKTKKKKKKGGMLEASSNIAKIMWGLYDYYCIQCKFNTSNNADYKKHLKNHETVLHICQICGYTTSSLSLFTRHKKKHKDERRFKCHVCDYKARHNMSLVYHLKSHDKEKAPGEDNKRYTCEKCGFDTEQKRQALRHMRVCKPKRYGCDKCDYVTKRRTDLKRHQMRKHMECEIYDDD